MLWKLIVHDHNTFSVVSIEYEHLQSFYESIWRQGVENNLSVINVELRLAWGYTEVVASPESWIQQFWVTLNYDIIFPYFTWLACQASAHCAEKHFYGQGNLKIIHGGRLGRDPEILEFPGLHPNFLCHQEQVTWACSDISLCLWIDSNASHPCNAFLWSRALMIWPGK